MLKLMLICNDPDLARFAVACGVDRIFVDLEVLGKQERQGHRDTVISRHSMADVPKVRRAVADAELLVRLNPPNPRTADEVEQTIAAGADLLMLPMFQSAAEVERLSGYVAGRAGIIPLVETAEAAKQLSEIVKVPGVGEIYIGLNDLHMALGLTFMFEPLANGMMDSMARTVLGAGLQFGFGGVARVGEGLLPAELVLGEHLRLGSSSVILSRTFHRHTPGRDEAFDRRAFAAEVRKLRDKEHELMRRLPEQQESDRLRLVDIVNGIVGQLKEG